MIIVQPGLLEYIYCAEHLKPDEVRNYEAADGQEFDAHRWAALLYSRNGVKVACFGLDGFPVAVGGYFAVRPGVWEVFMLSTPQAWPKSAVQITRTTRRTMEELFRQGAHRIECISLTDRPAAHKWYGAIGLKFESRVPKWGAHGEDAFRFARVKANEPT